MRIVRTPEALLGAFLVADGIILWAYGQSNALGAAAWFASVYAVAGAILLALGFKPRNRR